MTNPHLQRLALLKDFAPRLALGLMFMALTVLVELSYPRALAYFIDHIGLKSDGSWFGPFAATVTAVLALQAVATTMRYYLFESTGHLIVARIRRLLYGALIRQPVGFYDRHNVGELTSRLSGDVEILHDTLTMGLAISLRSLCVLAGCVVMLLLISPVLSLILLVYVPLTLFMGDWLGKHVRRRSRDIRQRQADCGSVAHEYFSNIRLVHAFNQQRGADARYANATAHALTAAIANTRLLASFRGVSSFVMYVALLATLWLGARLIGQGSLTVGELTSFVIYAGMVTSSSGAVSDFWSDWMRTIGATERVFEIIGSEAQPAPKSADAVALRGELAFRGVSFVYPERPEKQALDHVSFAIAAGESVALVGASGAGKSTIASMILGFYQPCSGGIAFDGAPAAQLDLAGVRAHIAIVEQEPSLFSGSIFENIAFALPDREVTRAEVVAAARSANAHDFIEGFPHGYDTVVGERGVQLSGGQKQRIAIARALLRNPKILILDEATSALDSASEQQVQQALDTLMAGRTTIVIAHRYSTIVKADRVLVLEHGAIVQSGAHAQLIEQRDGLYFHLMKSQMPAYREPLQASA